MKRYTIRGFKFTFLLVFFLITITSCATNKMAVKPIESKLKTISDNNITIALKFMSEKELLKLFGKENNPFVSPVSFLKSNRLMVFKLDIMNKGYSGSAIYLNKIELQYGGINARPFNRFQLANFWDPRLKKQPEYKRWNISILRNVIDKNVFDNKTLIKKGDSMAGYLVFKGQFPDYGKAVIYIPIFDKSGRVLKRYEIEFEF